MLSFEVAGGFAVADRLMRALRIITPAVSLGSTDTLIQHPAGLTQRVVQRADGDTKSGPTAVSEGLLRLAVGLAVPGMPIGSPGGDSQVQAILQVLLNIAVFGMDPQTAIEEPRFITYSHPDSFSPHPSYPGLLCLEGRFAPAVAASLSQLGHRVNMWPHRLWRAGGVCLVRHSRENGVVDAGADPRPVRPGTTGRSPASRIARRAAHSC